MQDLCQLEDHTKHILVRNVVSDKPGFTPVTVRGFANWLFVGHLWDAVLGH